MTTARTIAIVGAGCCGTVLATRLLQRPPGGDVRIVLIERGESIGRGVAYARRDHDYLLNVPASRMSADSSAPLEFLQHARRRLPDAGAEDFLPRSCYGDYLEDRLTAARMRVSARVRFEVWRANADAVRRPQPAGSLTLELDDGRRLPADQVVLAVGNSQPATLPQLAAIAGHPGYAADPWRLPAAFRPDERVLLVGAGLTMVDVATAAFERAAAPARMYAISRHGMLPPSQTAFRPDALPADGGATLLAAAPSVRRMMQALRTLARDAEHAGGDWREAVSLARRVAPQLWQRMPANERRRFLRHARAYWDAHRHRLPASNLQRIAALCKAGRLQIMGGRIQTATADGNAFSVTFRRRKSLTNETLVVDRVVNCTGPDYDVRRLEDPLWRNLRNDGLAVPDQLGLGLHTGADGAVVDAYGRPAPDLFYLGPMLRADHWEATAALELRNHAEQLAARLVSGPLAT